MAGVFDVANDVQVKLFGSAERDDTDLAQAVRHALEWDVLVPHERIRTTVSNGVVTLEGNVARWSQHTDAACRVRNLTGMREVRNFIRVDPQPRGASVADLRKAVEDAMTHNAEHAAKHVQISVVNGEVTLHGQVPSWADRSAIEGAVRGTVGVCTIDNQLRIQS